jgi:hypothetical protein
MRLRSYTVISTMLAESVLQTFYAPYCKVEYALRQLSVLDSVPCCEIEKSSRSLNLVAGIGFASEAAAMRDPDAAANRMRCN